MKKIILLLLSILLIAGLLVGCDANAAKKIFTHIVSFESNGGSAVTSQIVSTGKKATKPTDPTKGESVFEKWCSDPKLTAEFDFNTIITSDITLYAKWTTTSSCLAAGTMITMADGSKQTVETLKIGDMIKTFNHETGLVSSAPVCSFWAIEECYGNFVMHFSNGVSVSVVQEHCFFDMETNRYEVISYQNASEYIGHSFYNADKDRWEKLLSVDFCNEPVTAYYVFTAKHYNHFAEGMLSLDTLDEKSLTYVFDFGENLKFDEAKMLADIQKYGLMSIEEMPYVPQAYFDAVNMKYLKIAYGKGLADRQEVEKQIRYYISQMNL